MKQISTAEDVLSKKNIINRISDIPGGVSLTIADLVAGKVIPEGTPITAPSSGKRTVCKAVELDAGASTTEFVTDTSRNIFSVGDIVCVKEGGKASAIGSIVSDAATGKDTITVDAAIDDPTGLKWLYEASAEATGTYEADASLNVAYAASSEGGATGLTDDAESEDSPAPAGLQATKATIVGTVGAAGAGNIDVVVSSDVLASDITVVVALANDDTASEVAAKVRAALIEDSDVAANFLVSGTDDEIVLTRVEELSIDGAVFSNEPDAILKNAFVVPSEPMVIQTADAFIRADVREGSVPAEYLSKLPLIAEVKY